MKSIKELKVTELIINKSTFVNYLIPVSSLLEVEENRETLKKKHNDASHHCFAYILGNNQEIQKYSDDGEPSKTAGYPMMEVLKKHNLTNVLNVSIRYYGGIKLGAGGLVRAYTKGCANTVGISTFTMLANYTELKLSIPFDKIGNVEKYIRDNYNLLNTTYDELVNYTISIKSSSLKDFNLKMTELTKGKAIIINIKTYDKYE